MILLMMAAAPSTLSPAEMTEYPATEVTAPIMTAARPGMLRLLREAEVVAGACSLLPFRQAKRHWLHFSEK